MQKKASTMSDSALNPFVRKHQADVTGVLRGFDRLRFAGTFRALYHPPVMEKYIAKDGFLMKDFKQLVLQITGRIKAATQELAARAGRPLMYLSSSQVRKEQVARQIAAKDGVASGLIAVLSCVEPGRTYTVGGNRQTKLLEAQLGLGKCLHYYFYHLHPVFGFMHLRLQTWFPFLVNVGVNGREWLARQMTQRGLRFQQQDNCFTWIEDVAQAQRLLDEQMRTSWAVELEKLVRENHPTHRSICHPLALSYYWTACETEYATDLMFARPQRLAELYPRLVHHGIQSFGSRDVLRFLGYKPPGQGVGKFAGELNSSLKQRPEGLRIKHFVNHNSIKLYDKHGAVLRVETTINQPEEFKVWRAKENDPEQQHDWRELRRAVADLPRRAQVSHAANERYLTALAVVDETSPLGPQAQGICQAVRRDGRRYRGLNPWSQNDARILAVINRGEDTINGFRNRDLRARLYGSRGSDEDQKRRAGAITRKLRLLRAHGLIRKVSGTHRYLVTEKGRSLITALLTARQADIQKLTALAA
jgi:hypothetical protein